MPRLERDGEVFILHLAADEENRFHPDWLTALEAALDEVDTVTGPRALITAGSGKFWSNGLDTEWLSAHSAQHGAYLDRVNALLARTLASPTITVAALNGHTFAAGAMWALAHDLRVMRADRGFFCLPEVDIDLSFQDGTSELIRSRLTPAVTHEAMTTGRRYGGKQALTAGIVDAIDSADQLPATAVNLARPLASKAKPNRAQSRKPCTNRHSLRCAHRRPDEPNRPAPPTRKQSRPVCRNDAPEGFGRLYGGGHVGVPRGGQRSVEEPGG